MRLGNPRVAVDSIVELEGKWIEYPREWWWDDTHPMRAKVRGIAAKQYQLDIGDITKGLTPEQRVESAAELFPKLVAKAVLDFENWFNEDGKEIVYSSEICLAILANPDNRRVLQFTSDKAGDLSTYDVAAREEVEKNLQP